MGGAATGEGSKVVGDSGHRSAQVKIGMADSGELMALACSMITSMAESLERRKLP